VIHTFSLQRFILKPSAQVLKVQRGCSGPVQKVPMHTYTSIRGPLAHTTVRDCSWNRIHVKEGLMCLGIFVYSRGKLTTLSTTAECCVSRCAIAISSANELIHRILITTFTMVFAESTIITMVFVYHYTLRGVVALHVEILAHKCKFLCGYLNIL